MAEAYFAMKPRFVKWRNSYESTCLFFAPGRTEIGGNHTDHQHGCVLAAAVNLETVAEVTLNDSQTIWVWSEGYPVFGVDLLDLRVHEEEKTPPLLWTMSCVPRTRH